MKNSQIAKPLDVVCVGEALVDFLPEGRGQRARDVARWTPCLGGAPANVAVGLARLGATSALVGVTGADEFGHFLKEGLSRERVDVSCLRQTPEAKTGLGFVSLTREGERTFIFYRERSAERRLGAQDLRRATGLISRAKVLHIGTNSLLEPHARRAVAGAIGKAWTQGQLTSMDPNLRLHLWKEPGVLKALLNRLVPRCAVVKLSEEEITFVTGQRTVGQALAWLEERGVPLGVVTMGRGGARFRFRGREAQVRAPRVRVVDTTGAGDGFTAGLLFALTRTCEDRRALEDMSTQAMEACVRFGCLVGARVVTRLGAVAGLPRWAAELRRAGI